MQRWGGVRHSRPQWSPDGSEIAFYSNRSGTYQLWTIQADGSGLRQLTDVPDGAWFPYWSPDGTRIAFPTGKATCVFTVGDTPVSNADCLPDLSDEHWFEVRDWSPDGRWLVGNRALRTGEVLPELLLWSLETNEYQPLVGSGLVARWLPDSRHVVLLGEGGQPALIDRTSGAVHSLGSHQISGVVNSEHLGVSRDGRTVLVRSDTLESNIWLLSFPDEPSQDPS